LSKKKSKKSSTLKSRIRENAKLIIIVSILIGVSFYIGIATPSTYSTPINLVNSMGTHLSYSTTVNYGPFHSGVRVTFEVTSNSHSWHVTIISSGGTPLAALSDSDTGTFSTAWLYAPAGVVIQVYSDTTFPTSMNLDGTLSITSSRFPFI
jgi:hypothetical protein